MELLAVLNILMLSLLFVGVYKWLIQKSNNFWIWFSGSCLLSGVSDLLIQHYVWAVIMFFFAGLYYKWHKDNK